MTEPAGKQKVHQRSFEEWDGAIRQTIFWSGLHPLNEVELIDNFAGVTLQVTDISVGDGRDLV